MRKWLVVAGCALAITGSPVPVQGQKPRSQAILVDVALMDQLDDDGDPGTPGVPTVVWSSETFAGQVNPGLTTSSGQVCFAPGLFPTSSAYAPIEACGTGGPGVTAFGSVPVGPDFARQASISWVDSRGWEYRLQYGDAFTQPDPPNYAHVVCTGATAAGVCNAGSVDTTGGTFPSGDTTERYTGDVARLTVRTGSGKRQSHDLGFFPVPFALSVSPR